MPAKTVLFLLVLSVLFAPLLSWSQSEGTVSPYLTRIEHQTRDENVCMLVLQGGRYHLERTTSAGARVYEGALDASAISEVESLVNAPALSSLQQSQIGSSAAGDDVDQLMITTPRAAGWQTLTFPNSKSRKPYKSSIDPLLKWLDHNKQQQNPIAGAAATRCVPPHETSAAKGLATPNASNPYLMRIVVDHYESLSSGTGFSMDKGSAGESIGGSTATQVKDSSSFRITRTCAVVYASGRYRFEKSVREAGSVTHSDVYRESLNKTQLDELRQILDNPKLVALPNNVAPTMLGREGDLITLAILRNSVMQSLGFASSAPRPASASLQDASMAALSANIGLSNPVRKWVKQNLEDNKAALAKDVAPTTCVPSAQPE